MKTGYAELYRIKADLQYFAYLSQAFNVFLEALLITLTLSSLQTKTDSCANSVGPAETAHKESSHVDLHCLPFCIRF